MPAASVSLLKTAPVVLRWFGRGLESNRWFRVVVLAVLLAILGVAGYVAVQVRASRIEAARAQRRSDSLQVERDKPSGPIRQPKRLKLFDRSKSLFQSDRE